MLPPDGYGDVRDTSVTHESPRRSERPTIELDPVSSFAFHAKTCLAEFKRAKISVVDALQGQHDAEVLLEKERARAKAEVDKYLMEILRAVEKTQARLHGEIDTAVDGRHREIKELRHAKGQIDVIIAQAGAAAPEFTPQYARDYLNSGNSLLAPDRSAAARSVIETSAADDDDGGNMFLIPADETMERLIADTTPTRVAAVVASEQRIAEEAAVCSKLLRKHEPLIAEALQLVSVVNAPLQLKFRRQLCTMDLAALVVKDVSLSSWGSTATRRMAGSTRGATHEFSSIRAAAGSERSVSQTSLPASDTHHVRHFTRSSSVATGEHQPSAPSRDGGLGCIHHRQVPTPLVPEGIQKAM